MEQMKHGGEKFKQGDPNPGRGRPKGSENKVSRILKDAIMLAAELAGDRLRKNKRLKLTAEDGVVAYLEHVALTEPKAFLPLLAKVLPLQVHEKTEYYRREKYVTVEQARDRLRERGIPIEEANYLLLEHDDDDDADSDTKH
jgi:hypothetical protein